LNETVKEISLVKEVIFYFSLWSILRLIISGLNLCFAEFFEIGRMECEGVKSKADNLGRRWVAADQFYFRGEK
jgi:hypothetical protein